MTNSATKTKTCDNCAKLRWARFRHRHECAVLRVLVGETGDCWAWSGDPGWEKKVAIAYKVYAGRATKKTLREVDRREN